MCRRTAAADWRDTPYSGEQPPNRTAIFSLLIPLPAFPPDIPPGTDSFHTSHFSNYPWQRLNISKNTIKENAGYLKDNYIYEKERYFGDKEGDLRYYYKIIPNLFYATTLGQARNNYYEALNENKITIKCETLEEYLSSQKSARATAKIIFWIFYIILVCIGIYYFIYIENEWLED